MNLNELSDAYLLFIYSNTLKQQDQLYAQRKDIEKEISSRNAALKAKFERGEIDMERSCDDEYIRKATDVQGETSRVWTKKDR